MEKGVNAKYVLMFAVLCFCLNKPMLFHAVFPAGYLLLTLSFLNNLYKDKVLFSWQDCDKEIKLPFTSDVFDMFWIVLAAIPNALFAHAYCMDIYAVLSKWPRKIFVIGIAVGVIFALMCVISGTVEFMTDGESWLTGIDGDGDSLQYSVLEMISVYIVTAEAVGVVTCIVFGYFNIMQVSRPLAVSTLVASIVLFLYWLMLILSRIFNRMIMGDPEENKPLFSALYCFLGAISVLAIVSSVYLLASVPPSAEKPALESYRFVIGSILIPCVPIAIQLMQIISPKGKRNDQ